MELVLKSKIKNLEKKYFINEEDFKKLEEKNLENFITFLRNKFRDLAIEKILEKNNLIFEERELVVEKSINEVYKKIQKIAISFAIKTCPNYRFLIKNYELYLMFKDFQLVVFNIGKKDLDIKELSAYLVNEEVIDLIKSKKDFFIKEDKIESLNLFFYKMMKYFFKFKNKFSTLDNVVSYYNYSLKQKEKLLKTSLSSYLVGKKTINEKEFYKKIKEIYELKNNLDSFLSFLILLEKEKEKLTKAFHLINQ